MRNRLLKNFAKYLSSLFLALLLGLSFSVQAQAPDSLWQQAQARLAQGDTLQALQDLQEATSQAQDAEPQRALALLNYRTELLQELQFQERRLASAREALDLAKAKALQGPGRAKAFELLGYALLTEKAYPQSLPLLDSAARLHQQHQNHGDAAFAICGQVINYLHQGKSDSMALALSRSFFLAEKHLKPEHEVFSYLSSLQAIYFRQTEDYDAARNYQQRVLNMLLKAEKIDSLRLFKQYLNIGVMYRDRGDLAQALVSYQQALSLAEKLNVNSAELLFTLHFNTTSALLAQKNGAAAQKALDRCATFVKDFEEKESTRVLDFYNLKARLHMLRGEYEAAETSFRQAERLYALSADPQMKSQVLLTWLGQARLQAYRQDLPGMKAYLQLARKGQEGLRGLTNSRKSQLLAEEARYYHLTGQQDSAFQLLDRALGLWERTSAGYFLSPEVVDFLGRKGRWLLEEGELEKAYQQLDYALRLADSLSQGYHRVVSTFWYQKKLWPVYEAILNCCEQGFRTTQESQWLERAIFHQEKSKALRLQLEWQRERGFQLGGVPDSLQHRDRELRKDLAFYEERIFEERKKGDTADSLKLSRWQARRLQLLSQQDSLKAYFSRNYPQYQQHLVQEPQIDLAAWQQACAKEKLSMLSFFWGNESVFLFFLNQEKAAFLRIEDPNLLASQLDSLRSLIRRVSPKGDEVSGLSHRLYQRLLGTWGAQLAPTVMVVPDGPLAHLPFSLLLSEAPEDARSRSWPFLLRKHAFFYAYAAGQYFSPSSPPSEAPATPMLAMAPSFEGRPQQEAEALPPLEGAALSVEVLQQGWEGFFLKDSAASREAFLELAPQADLIHLATHALANNERPLQSKLYFAWEQGAGYQELAAWELYELKLAGRLVVLSACQSGDGPVEKGEGVMSLGQAFAFAGAPATLSSLWQAQDASTHELMMLFYQNLNDGLSKAEALQQAKLGYLAQAPPDATAPFFWAAFVLQGDPVAVRTGWEFSSNFVFTLVILLVGLLLLFSLRKK